jgi:hypothetical protein
MDYISQVLKEFYAEIGWRESNYYSNLDKLSKGLNSVYFILQTCWNSSSQNIYLLAWGKT